MVARQDMGGAVAWGDSEIDVSERNVIPPLVGRSEGCRDMEWTPAERRKRWHSHQGWERIWTAWAGCRPPPAWSVNVSGHVL